MRRPALNEERKLTPYQAYRLRTFAACGLHDVATISDGLQRQSARRSRGKDPDPAARLDADQ